MALALPPVSQSHRPTSSLATFRASTSSAHLVAPVAFDDINFEQRAYHPWLAYGPSKTANVLFAVEAARRWPTTASSPTR
jgi:hypothetical protein